MDLSQSNWLSLLAVVTKTAGGRRQRFCAAPDVLPRNRLPSSRVCGRWGSGDHPGRVAWEGESERNLVPGLLCSGPDLPRRQVDPFSALYEYGCDRRRAELRN